VIQLEDIYLKASMLIFVSRCISPQIKRSYVIILAHHTKADNPLASEPDVRSVSLGEGATHHGTSVVAC
jgi:hypothetical protein